MSESGSIVVIDDSSAVLEGLRISLSGAGYSVKTTTNLTAAPSLVPQAELVIVDFHMPGMSGEQLLPVLRKAAPAPQVCLFYLYTSDADVARRYESLGFDGGLLRKGDQSALLDQVAAIFRTIRMRKLAQNLRATRKSNPAK